MNARAVELMLADVHRLGLLIAEYERLVDDVDMWLWEQEVAS